MRKSPAIKITGVKIQMFDVNIVWHKMAVGSS
jgi:hypothetical protein